MALGYAGKVGFKFFICNLKTTSGGLFKNLRSRHKWKTLFMFDKNHAKSYWQAMRVVHQNAILLVGAHPQSPDQRILKNMRLRVSAKHSMGKVAGFPEMFA